MKTIKPGKHFGLFEGNFLTSFVAEFGMAHPG
jgi:hypothetical protein